MSAVLSVPIAPAETGETRVSAVDEARAKLAHAVEVEAAVRMESAGASADATRTLDQARSRKLALVQQRIRAPLEVRSDEIDRARVDVTTAELALEAATAETSELLAAAGAEVRHWRGVLLAALRDVLRQRLAAVHTAANEAERRVVEAQTAYGNLSTVEGECGRVLRGGGGSAPAGPDEIEAAIRRCDTMLAHMRNRAA